MSFGKLFSFILIFMMLMAALCYGLECDWRRCVYWLAAAVVNAAVTA